MTPGIKAIAPSAGSLKNGDVCVIYAQNRALAKKINKEEKETSEEAQKKRADYSYHEVLTELEYKEFFEGAVPIATGFCCLSELPKDLSGKAVQVEHRLFDELWNSGDLKIPEKYSIVELKIEKIEVE